MAMATAIRPTPTATAIRPITAATAATTGLTTAGTMAATMGTGSRGDRHPSCLLALRSIPRPPWPAQRFVGSTAAHCLQVRCRLRPALIHLSEYRDALLVSRRDDARGLSVRSAAAFCSRLRARLGLRLRR